MDIYKIIQKPLLTEKSTRLREQNKYVFVVDRQSNKIEIKKAVETMFRVNVVKVNTANMPGKTKRLGLHMGKRSDWKKAYVWLKKGEKIEALEV